MTLTIRTVDGWQLRVTERAEETLLAWKPEDEE